MSYIDDNLDRDEIVQARAVVHPIGAFFPAIIVGIVVVLIFLIAAVGGEFAGAAAIAIFGVILAVLPLALQGFVILSTTEFAITNKRIIGKRGLIRRETLETNFSRVESVHLQEGLVGRVFGFGTLVVVGTGGTRNPFPCIRDAGRFRRSMLDKLQD